MYYANQQGIYPGYNGYQGFQTQNYGNPMPQYSNVQSVPPALQNVQQQITQPAPTQQQPVQNQQPLLYGKVVDGIEVVRSYDVPIGATFLFPRADETTIYAKGWNANGTTYVKEYRILEADNVEENQVQTINWEEKLDDIYSSITNLNKKIDALGKKSSTTTRKKREVDDDDE